MGIMGRNKHPMPRKTIWMDPNGRVTIPKPMRDAAGLPEGGGWVVAETYPDSKNVKSVNVRPDK